MSPENIFIAILPILSLVSWVLIGLGIYFSLSKIFKVPEIPYKKILLVTLLFLIVGSFFKTVTSPITRPTFNEPLNDVQIYKNDAVGTVEVPVLEDKSLKIEYTDTSPNPDNEAKIKKNAEEMYSEPSSEVK